MLFTLQGKTCFLVSFFCFPWKSGFATSTLCWFKELLAASELLAGRIPFSDHSLHSLIHFLPNLLQSQEPCAGQDHKFQRSNTVPATGVGFLEASKSPLT